MQNLKKKLIFILRMLTLHYLAKLYENTADSKRKLNAALNGKDNLFWCEKNHHDHAECYCAASCTSIQRLQ